MDGYDLAKTPKQSTQIPLTEVVFTTIDSPDLQTIYVDGVTGSQTTRNTLRATFYEEYFPIPETERRQLTHKGGNTFGLTGDTPPANPDGAVNITRKNKVTLILSRKGLADLIPWLLDRLSELEAAERAELSGGRK